MLLLLDGGLGLLEGLLELPVLLVEVRPRLVDLGEGSAGGLAGLLGRFHLVELLVVLEVVGLRGLRVGVELLLEVLGLLEKLGKGA